MTTRALPPAFVHRLTALLGDEADSFFASYDAPSSSGLRVNTLKLTPSAFTAISPWPLTPVAWSESGFLIDSEAHAGKHPWHAAGLYYLQEPSALAVAEALDVQPGQLVLDLAGAPGGKATAIAALLQGRGTLVANEIAPARIKPLGENLERFGVANAVLLNEEPARLAERLGPIFDRVLLDAPCSGEGLFRKTPAARAEWSLEHVEGCAIRQAKILESAARLTRPGGALVYSTCTFAPEEDEEQIAHFLEEHPEFELDAIEARPGFSPGFNGLTQTVRLWPHHVSGEGHFIAKLRKSHNAELAAVIPERWTRPRLAPVGGNDDRVALEAWARFAGATIASPRFPAERLLARGEHLYLNVEAPLDLNGLKVVRPGLPLGMSKPGRFEPSHALALALHAGEALNRTDLDPEQTARYLGGEPILSAGAPGWTLITTGGWPLGWGKRDRMIVKNHYPKGLRRP